MWVEDGCADGLGQVHRSCSWCYQLSADPEGPGAGDALDVDVPALGQHIAVLAKIELGRLMAEVPLAADGGVLLVQAPGHNVLLRLEKIRDAKLDDYR